MSLKALLSLWSLRCQTNLLFKRNPLKRRRLWWRSRQPPVDNHTLYILMYHHFVPDTDEELNDWTLTESRFREDLQWLADNGYTTVLPRELARRAPAGEGGHAHL